MDRAAERRVRHCRELLCEWPALCLGAHGYGACRWRVADCGVLVVLQAAAQPKRSGRPANTGTHSAAALGTVAVPARDERARGYRRLCGAAGRGAADQHRAIPLLSCAQRLLDSHDCTARSETAMGEYAEPRDRTHAGHGGRCGLCADAVQVYAISDVGYADAGDRERVGMLRPAGGKLCRFFVLYHAIYRVFVSIRRIFGDSGRTYPAREYRGRRKSRTSN